METAILKALWAVLYILCAVLGFMPEQEGLGRWILIFLSLLFFLPPALLVWRSWKDADAKQLRLVRNLSVFSLTATTVTLLLHILSTALVLVMPVETALAVGDALYAVVNLVSAPMLCSQSWAVSLLLWAGLLWSAAAALKSLR